MPGKRAIIENLVYKTITGYYQFFFSKTPFCPNLCELKGIQETPGVV